MNWRQMDSEIKTFRTKSSDSFEAARELLEIGMPEQEVFIWDNPSNDRYYPALLYKTIYGIHIDTGWNRKDSGYENNIEAEKNVGKDLSYGCKCEKHMQ